VWGTAPRRPPTRRVPHTLACGGVPACRFRPGCGWDSSPPPEHCAQGPARLRAEVLTCGQREPRPARRRSSSNEADLCQDPGGSGRGRGGCGRRVRNRWRWQRAPTRPQPGRPPPAASASQLPTVKHRADLRLAGAQRRLAGLATRVDSGGALAGDKGMLDAEIAGLKIRVAAVQGSRRPSGHRQGRPLGDGRRPPTPRRGWSPWIPRPLQPRIRQTCGGWVWPCETSRTISVRSTRLLPQPARTVGAGARSVSCWGSPASRPRAVRPARRSVLTGPYLSPRPILPDASRWCGFAGPWDSASCPFPSPCRTVWTPRRGRCGRSRTPIGRLSRRCRAPRRSFPGRCNGRT